MPSRRHYSWPFSGAARAQELPLPYRSEQRSFGSSPSSSSWQQQRLYRKRPASSLKDAFNRPLSPETLIFPYSSSDEEDVFVSAGIVTSKDRPRRRRSKRGRRSRANHSKANKSPKKKESLKEPIGSHAKKEGQDVNEGIVSSITEANHLPSAVLRRLIRQRLDKAKQFLVPLHLHFSSATTTNSAIRREEKAILSCASTPALPSEIHAMIADIPDPSIHDHWRSRPDRRHRRCHSEQPRAWREPGPGLWTLAEE